MSKCRNLKILEHANEEESTAKNVRCLIDLKYNYKRNGHEEH